MSQARRSNNYQDHSLNVDSSQGNHTNKSKSKKPMPAKKHFNQRLATEHCPPFILEEKWKPENHTKIKPENHSRDPDELFYAQKKSYFIRLHKSSKMSPSKFQSCLHQLNNLILAIPRATKADLIPMTFATSTCERR
jgi:hypothetical protein